MKTLEQLFAEVLGSDELKKNLPPRQKMARPQNLCLPTV